jgi:hypothetical protein
MISDKLKLTAAVVALALPSLPMPGFAQTPPSEPAQVEPTPPATPPVSPGNPSVMSPGETGSTANVKCRNGYNFQVTTGSNQGMCKVYVERGVAVGAYCTDGSNSARQTCASGCKDVTGSGRCTMRDPTAIEGANQ